MAVRTRPADTAFPWDQRCLLAKRRRLLADATPTLPPGVAHPLTLSSRHAAVNLAICPQQIMAGNYRGKRPLCLQSARQLSASRGQAQSEVGCAGCRSGP